MSNRWTTSDISLKGRCACCTVIYSPPTLLGLQSGFDDSTAKLAVMIVVSDLSCLAKFSCWCSYRKYSRHTTQGGTAAAAPPPFRPSDPALRGSCPLVTPHYCRLGDLLCFVFMSACCMFDLSVYYMFLQYFDTVGLIFWPVKTVSRITYTVLAGT